VSTVVDALVIPPGWYPDPADESRTRWWNGTQWTHNVQDASPLAPLAPLAPLGTVVPGIQSSTTQTGYVPFQSAPRELPGSRRGIAYTRSVWWIAFHPLWAIVPQVVIVALVGVGSPLMISVGLAILNLVIFVVLVALAMNDRAALVAGGNGSTGSPWWMLLSPLAYLIARTIEVKRWDSGGWGPLIWWIVSSILSPGLALIGIFAVLGVLPF
jgi:hypothetical protein